MHDDRSQERSSVSVPGVYFFAGFFAAAFFFAGILFLLCSTNDATRPVGRLRPSHDQHDHDDEQD
jgi:hypothetical protein